MNRDHFWEAKTSRWKLEDGARKERHIFEGTGRHELFFIEEEKYVPRRQTG